MSATKVRAEPRRRLKWVLTGAAAFFVVAGLLHFVEFLSLWTAGGPGHPGPLYPKPPPPPDDVEPLDRTSSDGARETPEWRTSVRDTRNGFALKEISRGKAFDLRVRFAFQSTKCSGELVVPVGETLKYIIEEGRTLDLTIVADPHFFDITDADRSQPILISRTLPSDPCDSSSVDDKPLLAQATATFRLTAKDTDIGRGRIAVVIYHGGRPVDEIPLSICVDCSDGDPVIVRDNRFSDAAYALMNAAAAAPPTDASIYLFDFTANASAGTLVLRQADGTFRYYPWTNADTMIAGIRQTLLNTYADVLSKTTDTPALARKGEELAEVLFPPDRAAQVRAALEMYLIDAHVRNAPVPGLFVRIASMDDRTPIVFPVGLMAMKSVTDGSGFLGRYANITMPLTKQDYTAFNVCPEEVMTLLPKEDDANGPLKSARSAMGDVGQRWSAASPTYRWNTTGEFERWTFGNPVVQRPAALFILSHHYNSSIWISRNEKVQSEAIKRIKFVEPSWVVLNGCASADPLPSGTGFAQLLNKAGAQAVIATHSEVPAPLAGAYYSCLDEVLRNAPADRPYRLGSAHFSAVDCVWRRRSEGIGTTPGPEWGANSLKYTLLGNPNLRVCAIK